MEVDSGTLLLHHIARAPFDRDFLSEEKLRESYWLTKHCHGLDWDRGDIPFHVLTDKLRACIANRPNVYVKGSEKKEFIQRHFVTDHTATTVVDLGDLGCGSLTSTANLLSTNTLRCGHHKSVRNRCAMANCLILRGWLFLTANNKTDDKTSCFCSCICPLTTTNTYGGIDTVQ